MRPDGMDEALFRLICVSSLRSFPTQKQAHPSRLLHGTKRAQFPGIVPHAPRHFNHFEMEAGRDR